MSRSSRTVLLLLAACLGAWVAPQLRPVRPAASEPAASEPAASEPAASEPAASEPAASEPIGCAPPIVEPDEVTPPPPQAHSVAPIGLLDPARLGAIRAPDHYRVRFDTTEGPFLLEVHRSWAPIGADRLYGLVANGFYDGTSFFRVIDGFVVQWGIHPSPEVNSAWRDAKIKDDPIESSNTRGRLTFATAGPNTRTTQLYINLVDNTALDKMGFAPLGDIVEGMEIVDALYSGYAEGTPRGRGPDQNKIQSEGDTYLVQFPELDRIVKATIVAVP